MTAADIALLLFTAAFVAVTAWACHQHEKVQREAELLDHESWQRSLGEPPRPRLVRDTPAGGNQRRKKVGLND